nr:hypothetical protein [Tanacetum cinerariifolium]
RMIAEMDQDDAVVLKDDKEENKEEDETEPAEVQEVVDVVTTAKLITEVVTTASKTVTAASVIITTVEAQVPAATAATITAAPDPAIKRYQAMKRKPQTEAQARKNMMMYLNNVDGFKFDYFKGMSYDDIRLIFEAKFNSNVNFLLKTKEQMEKDENRALQTINETPAEKAAKRRKLNEEVEELKRHLQIVPNEDDDVYTEATPLARKEVEELKRHLQIVPNEDDDVYTEATPLARKDLEALWSLVKERFSTAKPKNFFDDFLLTTLGAMFEKPDAHAQI